MDKPETRATLDKGHRMKKKNKQTNKQATKSEQKQTQNNKTKQQKSKQILYRPFEYQYTY